MTISKAGFTRIAEIFLERAGIVLAPNKSYLLQSRLTHVARTHGFLTVADLADGVAAHGGSEALYGDIVEAMLNNETFFFRDTLPFEMLQKSILPRVRAAKAHTRRIRIWSAAASSGQEAYSIAMLFAEDAALWDGWTIEILGTDLSAQAIEKAVAGRYSQFEVQRGLTIHRLMRHFEKIDENWVLKPEIRRRVEFRRINLCDPWPFRGGFDIIFCRNVLMYLARSHKTEILERMVSYLAAGGGIILGAAETVIGVTDMLEPDWDNRGLYRPAAVQSRTLAV